ncbi:tRNA pseudouridine synthase A [Bienertia sinuspersici]
MAKIPIKFKRVAAAFDEAAKWRQPCDSSSGSEYWPVSGTDLSDLVNSFIEKGDYGVDPHTFAIDIDNDIGKNCDDEVNWVSDNDDDSITKRKELLHSLLLECTSSGNKNNGIKQKIRDEIDFALKQFGGCNSDPSRSGLKRKLMTHLRDKGFDAGLCKSRWAKTGRTPAGTYEYIDVNVGKTRYIVEVFIAGEFEIIRPTNNYTSLLGLFPSILIIEKPQILKQILRLITKAMKDSLKQANIHVAPWRRNGYMQAKYFSPYKRTINRESTIKDIEIESYGLAKKRSMVGFEAHGLPNMVSYYCRDVDFGISKVNGVRVGLLASALQGK